MSARAQLDAVRDPRVAAGLERQLTTLRQSLASGSRLLGWKVGFGAPAILQKLQITAPLTGYLLTKNRLASGTVCRLKGWIKPVVEPEIAVHLGVDVAGGGSLDEARAAIAALSPAIELADLSFSPDHPEQILAENVFQRHVLVGDADRSRAAAKLDGMTGRLVVDGREVASTSDLEANTGPIVGTVRHVADTLAATGQTLRAGEIIICGSVVPPVQVTPEHREVRFVLEPLGELSVRLSHD